MNNLKVTKKNVVVLILSLLMVFALPMDFFWGNTTIELMEEGRYHVIEQILLWIFYISLVATNVTALMNKYDVSQLAATVGVGSVVCVFLYWVIDYRDGGIFSYIGFGAYYCLILSVILLVLVKKDRKK